MAWMSSWQRGLRSWGSARRPSLLYSTKLRGRKRVILPPGQMLMPQLMMLCPPQMMMQPQPGMMQPQPSMMGNSQMPLTEPMDSGDSTRESEIERRREEAKLERRLLSKTYQHLRATTLPHTATKAGAPCGHHRWQDHVRTLHRPQ